MQQGRSYLVHIHIDEETQRIVASAKVERYLQPANRNDYHRGQEVEIIIQQKTPLGFKVIADNRCPGLIYDDQIFEDEPHAGDVLSASPTLTIPHLKNFKNASVLARRRSNAPWALSTKTEWL